MASVKTDVGGVKTDVAATKSDLETTKSQLNRVVGDAGVMSGLIATNHGELEELKHRGDRNYFEFTLQKGAKPTLLSTIKLQAKKVDEKKSRYTLIVSADDRNIEKKDRNLDEPVQFYTGKDPVLYELVVNSIEKNRISGYLSTPKNPQHPVGIVGIGRIHAVKRKTGDAFKASPVCVCLLDLLLFCRCLFCRFLGCFFGCHLPVLPIDQALELQHDRCN